MICMICMIMQDLHDTYSLQYHGMFPNHIYSTVGRCHPIQSRAILLLYIGPQGLCAIKLGQATVAK